MKDLKVRKARRLPILLAVALSVLVASSSFLVIYNKDQAVALQNFNPGNIIQDNKMADYTAMSEAQIRSFINDKNKNCPNNNSLCLRNYREGGKDAARIIFEASREHRINPQVILVTIQKEQGLVTHTNPSQWMYNSAMGYNCPDSTPGRCGSEEQGFMRQVIWGSTMYRAILDGGGAWSNRYANGTRWFTPYVLGNNSVQWHPNTSCGTSTVNIQNRATQALYNYTPYRPNQAALNAGYGEGNGCSSYGNRNFYLFMRDWFNYTVNSVDFSGITFKSQPFAGKEITARFTLRNTGSSTVNLGRLKVEARGPNSEQFDFPNAHNVSIGPGRTFTYEATRTINMEGQFRFTVERNYDNRWLKPAFSDLGNNAPTDIHHTLVSEPTIIESLALSESSIHQNQPIEATFAIRNNSHTYAVNVGRLKVEGRHSDGKQYDFGSTPNNLTIDPGETYKYKSTRALPSLGNYNLKIMNFRDGYRWSSSFPSSGNDIIRSIDVTVMQPVTISEGLNISHSPTRVGNPITATFNITNFSNRPINIGRMKVEGRYSDGTQYDFGSTPSNLVLQPGETYKYEKSRSLPKVGSYSFVLMNHRTGHGWSTSFPISESSNINRGFNVVVKQPVTVTNGLELSKRSGRTGDPFTATFTMKNHSSQPVNIGRMKVEGRYSDGTQYDFGSTPSNLVLQPGEVYEYERSRSLPEPGSYTFVLMNFRDGHRWSASYPASESSSVGRSATFSAKGAVTITESLKLSGSSVGVGQPLTATFTMKNHSSQPVNIGRMKVEGRHSDGKQYDFGSTPNNLVLQPGETYEYERSRSLPRTGSYTFVLMNYRESHRWSTSYPESENSSIGRQSSVTVR